MSLLIDAKADVDHGWFSRSVPGLSPQEAAARGIDRGSYPPASLLQQTCDEDLLAPITSLLLAAKADPTGGPLAVPDITDDASEGEGEGEGVLPSPLFLAAAHAAPQTVRALLEAGAPVDQRGREGITALMAAAEVGHTPIVQLLLEAKADATHHSATTPTMCGQSALVSASFFAPENEGEYGESPHTHAQRTLATAAMHSFHAVWRMTGCCVCMYHRGIQVAMSLYASSAPPLCLGRAPTSMTCRSLSSGSARLSSGRAPQAKGRIRWRSLSRSAWRLEPTQSYARRVTL